MKLEKVVEIIEKIAPPELGASWDNSGIQINTGKKDIRNILVCLDITDDVIDEAIDKNVDLIISHHPLLFVKPGKIDVEDVTGRYVIKLIKSDIAVYSAHIPFDSAPMGNNFYMAKLLGMTDVQEIEGEFGVTGTLEKPLAFLDAVKHVEDSLKLPKYYVKAVGEEECKVERIALCTGAGGEVLYSAKKEGCQMVVTGDVKHNVALDAKAMGICLVDAGHYGTEKIFAENFISQMEEEFKHSDAEDVKVFESQINTNPYVEL